MGEPFTETTGHDSAQIESNATDVRTAATSYLIFKIGKVLDILINLPFPDNILLQRMLNVETFNKKL